MRKIRSVIIDDEIDSIRVTELLLSKHCTNVEIVGTAQDVDTGFELINSTNPHLVFLDIEMPGQNGFELLRNVESPNFHTIVVTGYEQYAIEAIKHLAIDYLLKPLKARDLISAVAKVDPLILQNDPRTTHLFELLADPQKIQTKLIIPSHSGFQSIEFDDILSIKSQEGNYSILNTKQGKVVATKALNYFEQLLPLEGFFRIHRSHLVNLAKIKYFDNKADNVELINGELLQVATRKRATFRQAYLGFSKKR